MMIRHNTMKGFRQLVLGSLLVVAAAHAQPAAAQDLDPYHAFMLEFLSDLGITGGDLVLGTDAVELLNATGVYGIEDPEIFPSGTAGDHEFDYLRLEVDALTNPWDAGMNWQGQAPVLPGEAGIAMILIRGATVENAEGRVTFIFERNVDPWDKSLDRQYDLSSDWTLFIEPFTFANNLQPGESQFAFHLSHRNQWIEMTAPVVINFHDQYTEAVLQGIIDQGGGTPTVASFTATPLTGPAPLEITLDASGSTTGGTITSYAWAFGDGTNGSGETVTHTYDERGTYTITLTITDNSGTTATATRQVTVTALEGSLQQPIEIPYTEVAPVIDGERDAVWDNAKTVAIESLVNNSLPSSDEDLSGTASVLWDETNIYVFYEVRDEAQFNVNTAFWQNDAVDFYIDALNSKSDTYDLSYQAQMEFGWEVADTVGGKGPRDNTTFEWFTTSDGYNIEAAVPWADFEVEPDNDMLIGVEFMINDNDTGAMGDSGRQTKLAWFGLEDNAWQFPRLFGNAILTGRPVSSEGNLEVPQAFVIESVYPNPFNPTTTVAVQVRDVGEYRVRVYNVLGQLVSQQQLMATAVGRMEVPLAFHSMASGLYSVAVEHTASGKIVTTTAVLMK